MWAGAKGFIPGDVAAMSVYAFIWSNGSSWYDTVAIAANIRNFPEDRGRITGLLKSLYGLCASIITIVYSSFFKSDNPQDAIDILLFLTIFSATVGVIGIPTTKLIGPRQALAIAPNELKYITIGMWCLLLLGTYILIVSILEEEGEVQDREAWPTGLMAPLLLMQMVMLVPAFFDRQEVDPGETKPLLEETANGVVEGEGEADDVPVVDGASLMEIAKDGNFWLLSFVTMFGTGAGLTVINNIAQQVKAARGRGAEGSANLYIVLISVANCGGRLFWGFCTDRFPQINRAGWLSIVSASTACAMFVSAYADIDALVLACLWMGLSYGGYWAVMPGILAELYGTKWFAVAYSVVSLFPALGSFLLSATLTGGLYDENTDPGDQDCYGQKCFRDAYLVIAFLCVLGTLLGLLLTYRTRTIVPDIGM